MLIMRWGTILRYNHVFQLLPISVNESIKQLLYEYKSITNVLTIYVNSIFYISKYIFQCALHV